MPNYQAPDVYIEEIPSGPRPIEGVGTSTAGFVGVAPDRDAFVNEPVAINNWMEFTRKFVKEGSTSTDLSQAVYGFFNNEGTRCYVVNIGSGTAIAGGGRERVGLDVLEQIDQIAIVSAPGFTTPAAYDAVLSFCEKRKNCVAILDAPQDVSDITKLTQVAMLAPPARGAAAEGEGGAAAPAPAARAAQGLRARQSDSGYGAYYFPWVLMRDPLSNGVVPVAPSGLVAGVWARTDGKRGVHKAPANEALRGALGTTYTVTRDELGVLNSSGVNVIRPFSNQGVYVWGARTLADSSSEFRYLPVRRLTTFIEQSIQEGMRWVVFEPNALELWKNIQRDVSAFLMRLWRDGALMGASPQQAFFVKCDAETNPQENIDAGIVTTIIGIAPVKPAEFVVFKMTQYAGNTDSE